MNLLGGCVKWQTKSDDVGVEVLEEFDIQTTKVVQIWMRFKVECSRLIFGQLTNLFSETAGRVAYRLKEWNGVNAKQLLPPNTTSPALEIPSRCRKYDSKHQVGLLREPSPGVFGQGWKL
ncbi:hypothetical protein HG530_011107 [Fusarium avenaceum]|nr:hypothetical protein HG530_011107 [Fusarium avenaceum]